MSSRKRRRLWASIRAAGAGVLARTREVLTTEPGGEGDAGERAAAHQQASDARAERGGLAKLAQLRAYFLGPGAARDGQARTELAALWDRAEPAAWADVLAVLEDQLGDPDEIFEQIDTAPLASASLGQVHAALWKGREVVVKVQYPGVAETLAGDLEDDRFVRQLFGVDSGRGMAAGAQALREVLARELDYREEANAQRRFIAAFSGDPSLSIPGVIDECSTERVLTTERVRGRSLMEVVRAKDDDERSRLGRALLHFHFASILGHGLLNADPNPGNVLIPEQGPPVFIDFGAWLELDPELLGHEQQMWRSLLMDDQVRGVVQFRSALVDSGLASAAEMGSANQAEWERLLALPVLTAGSFRWSPEYAEKLVDSTSRMLRLGGLEVGSQLSVLWRARLGVASLLGALRAEVDARAVLEPLL
ncbi:MAG: hypothetical protein KJO07_07690 [Deltaproteobacteria bacterium]|nr:hypothetical protein [Deltaproteobacteria bacterium]